MRPLLFRLLCSTSPNNSLWLHIANVSSGNFSHSWVCCSTLVPLSSGGSIPHGTSLIFHSDSAPHYGTCLVHPPALSFTLLPFVVSAAVTCTYGLLPTVLLFSISHSSTLSVPPSFFCFHAALGQWGVYRNHINLRREGGIIREGYIKRFRRSSVWGKVIHLVFFALCQLRAWWRWSFFVNSLWYNISGAVKEVTGRGRWTLIIQAVWSKMTNTRDCARICTFCTISLMPHLSPATITRTIYIIHLKFHYFPSKVFVIDFPPFPPAVFLCPDLPLGC